MKKLQWLEELWQLKSGYCQLNQDLAQSMEKDLVISAIMPLFKQLSADDQDSVRILCLESLKKLAKVMNKDENKTHALPRFVNLISAYCCH